MKSILPLASSAWPHGHHNVPAYQPMTDTVRPYLSSTHVASTSFLQLMFKDWFRVCLFELWQCLLLFQVGCHHWPEHQKAQHPTCAAPRLGPGLAQHLDAIFRLQGDLQHLQIADASVRSLHTDTFTIRQACRQPACLRQACLSAHNNIPKGAASMRAFRHRCMRSAALAMQEGCWCNQDILG